jgi:hypothetical protein
VDLPKGAEMNFLSTAHHPSLHHTQHIRRDLARR